MASIDRRCLFEWSAPNCVHVFVFLEDTEWQRKLPIFWTADDIINWMYCTAAEMSVDCEGSDSTSGNQCGCNLRLLSGENWRNIDGHRLCSMTIDEFTERDRHHGHLFYKLLHQLPLDDCKAASTLSTYETMLHNQRFRCINDPSYHDLLRKSPLIETYERQKRS